MFNIYILTKKFNTLLFLVVILLFSGPDILAQNTGSEEESGGTGGSLQFNFNTVMGELFYQDPLGLQIASQGISSEGTINEDIYVLGSNDLLSIAIKSSQPLQVRGIVVNPQGDIVIPSIGMINVAGKTITEAKSLIQQRATSVFSNPEVSISIDKPRMVSIHINGDISRPGKYAMPAQSRVDFALIQAVTEVNPNPEEQTVYSSSSLLNKNFALRKIHIERKDGNIDTADLINYYTTGALEDNPFVRDGDLITIYNESTNDARISLSGAVRSPFEIQFLESDSPKDLLEIAGGFTSDADTSSLLILRRNDDSIQKINVSSSQWTTFQLQPNDRLVAKVDDQKTEAASAWISGEVSTPGNYPIVNGSTTAYELLEIAGDLTEQALPNAGYLIRAGSIENEIPNKFNAELMKRTSNQLSQGLQYLETENRLSRNRVHVDLTDSQQLQSVKLFNGDRLFVPRDENTVFVYGQVNNPGYFPYEENQYSINEYILRAGGFSLAANQEEVYIIKAGNKAWHRPENTSLESGDMIFVDREPYDELNAKRNYEIQKQQIKNTRIQLILSAISTITGIITTYVAIQNIRN